MLSIDGQHRFNILWDARMKEYRERRALLDPYTVQEQRGKLIPLSPYAGRIARMRRFVIAALITCGLVAVTTWLVGCSKPSWTPYDPKFSWRDTVTNDPKLLALRLQILADEGALVLEPTTCEHDGECSSSDDIESALKFMRPPPANIIIFEGGTYGLDRPLKLRGARLIIGYGATIVCTKNYKGDGTLLDFSGSTDGTVIEGFYTYGTNCPTRWRDNTASHIQRQIAKKHAEGGLDDH